MPNIFENSSFIKNQSVVLTDDKGSTVRGLFVAFNRNKTRLELHNVLDCHTNECLGKIKFYYNSAVKNIKTMTQELTPTKKEDSLPDIVPITRHQQESVEKIIQKFVLINQTDESYHKAVQQLSVQPSIGLSWEGCENGRLSKLSMLAFATSSNIFVFDIIYLGNTIPKGLKMVLQDPSICKVIHNALLLCDALYHTFNVEIANIFDTMLASTIYDQRSGNERFEICICNFLGIKVDFEHKSSRSYTNIRPIPHEDLLHLSKTCGYLLFLYHFLVNNIMLKSFRDKIVNEHCFSTKLETIDNIGMIISNHDFTDKHKKFKLEKVIE